MAVAIIDTALLLFRAAGMTLDQNPEHPGAATVVLVHGGFLGAWVWADVTADIEARASAR